MQFLTDENIKNTIIRGIQRIDETIDIVRVQDVGLISVDDPAILEWAAQKNRILITHDVNTMPGYATDRIIQGQKMPGMIAIKQEAATGLIIEDLLITIGAGHPEDFENLVVYIPL